MNYDPILNNIIETTASAGVEFRSDYTALAACSEWAKHHINFNKHIARLWHWGARTRRAEAFRRAVSRK